MLAGKLFDRRNRYRIYGSVSKCKKYETYGKTTNLDTHVYINIDVKYLIIRLYNYLVKFKVLLVVILKDFGIPKLSN